LQLASTVKNLALGISYLCSQLAVLTFYVTELCYAVLWYGPLPRRAHMNVDPNMQAFWDDITVLLVSVFY
jgi:hypothetical protein